MASIASTVARFKDELAAFLDDRLIRDACAATGHAWRERVLGAVVATDPDQSLDTLSGTILCPPTRPVPATAPPATPTAAWPAPTPTSP